MSLRSPIVSTSTTLRPPRELRVRNQSKDYSLRRLSMNVPPHVHLRTRCCISGEEKQAVVDGSRDDELPPGLHRDLLPKHVAVIMDGNSRWARSRGIPTSAGYVAGIRAFKELINHSSRWGIRALTVFAFSSDNWARPRVEIDFLVSAFGLFFNETLGSFMRDGIRVSFIGDLTRLPESAQKLAGEVEEKTGRNSRMDLILAIGYSGRTDIVQACRRISRKVMQGELEPDEITESLFAHELQMNRITKFPSPDLLIRTSGEMRLSNFLLWQSAYTELYFTQMNWPDFREEEYVEALASFQKRQRRFGRGST